MTRSKSQAIFLRLSAGKQLVEGILLMLSLLLHINLKAINFRKKLIN